MAGSTAKKRKGAKWGEDGNPAGEITWKDADADKLHRALACADRAGVALLFGRTRAGNTLSIRLFEQDGAYSRYLPPSCDLDGELDSLAEYFVANYPDSF